VRGYAGLDTLNYGSASPVAPFNNQSGLTDHNLLTVTLEYSTSPGQWCYSPSSPQPVRVPAVPACSLYNGAYPPLPSASQFYRVRVTVSSTTDGLFTRVIGENDNIPPPPTSDDVAACLRPQVKVSGAWGPLMMGTDPAPGNTACAHAVVVVKGSTSYAGTGSIIPMGTGNCQIVPSNAADLLFELWGAQPNGCGTNINPWKNFIDLTADRKWCDDASGGSATNPDYKYYQLLPPLALGYDARCPVLGPSDGTWQRDDESTNPNARYKRDPNYLGINDPTKDIPYWVANGFGGSIKPDSCPTCTDGVRLPTYEDVNPGAGSNLGQNIALSFYCDNTATANTCPGNAPANTYYFAKNQPGFQNECADVFAAYGVGCRDSGVILWTDPQRATGLSSGGTGWISGGAPDRIRVARILNFRIYCDHATTADHSTTCSSPPKSIVGNAANSTVWGRFVSPAVIGGPCLTCTSGPSINGNTASLES
jgi:hypothetical protein